MATNCEVYDECPGRNEREENFACSICLCNFVKPRTLPCSHTFCHSCLVNCLNRLTNNQRFCCPFCRTNTKIFMSENLNAENVVEKFLVDFALIKKMKTSAVNTDTETDSNLCKPCLRDKTYEPASVYCCECSEILCVDCKKHHSKNKLTTNHTVIDIKGDMAETRRLNFVQNLTKCKNHPLEEVKYLCKDHDQLCCNECAILTHRKCQTLQSLADSISSGYQKCVTENLETMEKHVVNMKKHEVSQRQSVCSSETVIKDQLLCIKAEFDHAFSVFEDRVLKQVRANCNGFSSLISSQQMDINKFEAHLKRSKEKVESVDQYGQDLHKFIMEREMKNEIEQNEKVLNILHRNANCSEVSLAGIENISNQLSACLNQTLSVTVKQSSNTLPKYPTFKHTGNQIVNLTINEYLISHCKNTIDLIQ